ncbi:retrovirus-related Pol polyprotein from transposon 297 [Trichonephila clavipes]|nr:retrovirus-related Pol polyprotein from transposon 297 [Trichonephila clavipes]
MPFGLCNAPATFERLMETVLKGLTFEACLIYLDDVIIGGRTLEEHLQNIRKVLSKLRDANLKLNPSKCKFFQKEVNYLGHIISTEGVRTDPEKVSAVKNWKRPENLRELRSFLGLCTYYRKFVKGFSNIARPLHKLTESKQKFQWTKECEDSFLQLKEALTSSSILIYPQPDKPFILDTDASNESVGAVLSQEIDGQEQVVAYWSKCLSKSERNYCVTRKELLAIVKAIEHFHHYLYGQKFLLRTDHASLTWLMNFRNTEGQVARWIQRLNEYYFDIRHRKGSSHGNADALSEISSLRCFWPRSSSPCDLLFGRPPDTPSSPEEYVQNLQARFEDVHNLARERINLRTEKMKTRYDTKATGHQFKEGDKVWFYNPTRRKGLSP